MNRLWELAHRAGRRKIEEPKMIILIQRMSWHNNFPTRPCLEVLPAKTTVPTSSMRIHRITKRQSHKLRVWLVPAPGLALLRQRQEVYRRIKYRQEHLEQSQQKWLGWPLRTQLGVRATLRLRTLRRGKPHLLVLVAVEAPRRQSPRIETGSRTG